MLTKYKNQSFASPIPMSPSGSVFLEALKHCLPSDSALLGLFHMDHPQLDEVLACQNWSAVEVRDWVLGLDQGVHHESDEHLLVCQRIESVKDRRVWILALRREVGHFSSVDRVTAQCRLAYWQTLFNYGLELGLTKFLLGHDGRLIHADPLAQLALAGDDQSTRTMFEALQRVVAQRWPDLVLGQVHDFVMERGEHADWICFTKQRVFELSEAVYWSIERRPMQDKSISMTVEFGDDRVARAVAFIRDHFHENPSLTTIAQAARVSPYHFHRLFTKHVGTSPKQYLQARQLQVAQWMLAHGRLSVGEIALRCGFSDHGHFTATFGRRIGVRPMDYRQATCTYDPYALMGI